MADSDLARCLHDVEIAVKDNKIYVDSYICTRIFAELKYPDEVVKTTTKGNLLKQSTFYKETRDEVCRRAGKAASAPYSQRGLVRFQTGYMGGYTRSWKETPPTSMTGSSSLQLLKGMREFERKLDRMARGYQGHGCNEAHLSRKNAPRFSVIGATIRFYRRF